MVLGVVGVLSAWRSPGRPDVSEWQASTGSGEPLTEVEHQACVTSRDSLRSFTLANRFRPDKFLYDRAGFNTDTSTFTNYATPTIAEGAFQSLNGHDFNGILRISDVDLDERTASLRVTINPWREDFPRIGDLPPQSRVTILLWTDGGVIEAEGDPTVLTGGSAYASFTIELSGDQARFPDDFYTLTIRGIWIEARSDSTGDRYATPVGHLVAYPGPAVSESIRALPGFAGQFSATRGCTADPQLVLFRDRSGWTLRWAIVLSPIVLVALLLRSSLRDQAFEARGIIEVSATLLAILPLRAVLVPGSISTLTRIDDLLAIQLLAMIWILAFGYYLRSRGSNKSPSA